MKKIGGLLIIAALLVISGIFIPVVKQELKYQADKVAGITYIVEEKPIASPSSQLAKVRLIQPVSTDFGLVIPKINLNAKVFPQVDSTNPDIYLPILKKGVAQAKGSAYPGQVGNVFLFAHSTDAFYNVATYNAVFFLIGKLEKGDEVNIFYQGQRFVYNMEKKAVVSAEELSDYVLRNTKGNSLTLQTCYPPGTTLKRLIVIAQERR